MWRSHQLWAVGAWETRAHGGGEGRVRGFLGGVLRCQADSESPSQKKKIQIRRTHDLRLFAEALHNCTVHPYAMVIGHAVRP